MFPPLRLGMIVVGLTPAFPITMFPNGATSVIQTFGPVTVKPYCTWRAGSLPVNRLTLNAPGVSGTVAELKDE